MCTHSPAYLSMTDAERAEVDAQIDQLDILIKRRRARVQAEIDEEISQLERLQRSAQSEADTFAERISDLQRSRSHDLFASSTVEVA